MSTVNEEIEIEGNRFRVLKRADEPFDDSTIHSALLVVTPEELDKLRGLFGRDTIVVRRAPSADALSARWGGAMYWSRHVQEGQAVFKHVIRYLPADAPRPGRARPRQPPLSGHELLSVSLLRGLDTLTRTLVAKGVLSGEERDVVLRESWRDLRLDLQTEGEWVLHECADAEGELE